MNFFCFANSKTLLRFMHRENDMKCVTMHACCHVHRPGCNSSHPHVSLLPLSLSLARTSRRFKPVSARLSYHSDKARLGEGIYAEYGPAAKSGALDAALRDAGSKGGACTRVAWRGAAWRGVAALPAPCGC
jgi:hypothetical protein